MVVRDMTKESSLVSGSHKQTKVSKTI